MRPSIEDRAIAGLLMIIAVGVSILLGAVAIDVMDDRAAQRACRSRGGVPITAYNNGWRCVLPTEVR